MDSKHLTFSRQSAVFAQQLCFLALTALCCLSVGCGGSNQETVADTAQSSSAETAARNVALGPAEIVSQLLDRVRRGGENDNSSELLTKLAQQELIRIGRPFEFPGSPDTVYEVMKAVPIPDEKDKVWVQTVLKEPAGSGQFFQYEVVWTLHQETAGWRVSGFAIDQGENLEPLVFDFENGDEMAARLAAIESTGQQSDQQSGQPSVNR